MDDNKISNIQSPISNTTNQQVDAVQSVQQTQIQPAPAQNSTLPNTTQNGQIKQEEWVLPTGGAKKEAAPLPTTPAQSETITPSEQEIQLPKEVAEAGVETVSDMPKLSDAEKAAGLEVAKEATPAPTVITVTPHVALTLDDVKKETSGQAIFKDAGRARYWLAMLLQKYILQRQHKEQEEKVS